MIRIDEIWLATEPLDMRAGPGTARPHCAYLFANRRGNRMKVLIHDGLGDWLCARRLRLCKLTCHDVAIAAACGKGLMALKFGLVELKVYTAQPIPYMDG